MINRLRAAIGKKGCALGTFLGLSDPAVVEVIGYTGMDFIVIDTEHGPYDTMPMSDLIRAAINRILNACKSAGKLCIMFCGGAADAKKYKEMGFDAISVGVDANVLMDAYRALVDEVHSS